MTKRQKMTRNLVVVILILPVSLAVGFALRASLVVGGVPRETAQGRMPLSVSVARAAKVAEVSLTRKYTGVVKAARESELSFERTGRVLSMVVDEGDAVEQGQLLGTIDVQSVAAQLDAAEAQLLQAKAVLAELVAGPRAETIASTRARVVSLDANAKRLSRDFHRYEELIVNSAISQERYDATKYQLAAATAEKNATQKQLDELLAGTRIEQLNAQRANVQQLEAQVRTLQLDLDDGNLHAPFAGRIAERLVDEGTVVGAGATAFRIVDDATLEVWIGIPRATARHLKVGQSYEVNVSDQRLSGRLISLRPQLDSLTRTQNAVFRLNSEAALEIVPGEIARISVVEQVEAAGFVIPSTALTPGPRGLWNILVINDSVQPPVAEHRNVELLYSLDASSLVNGTLREGEAIVIDGVHRIVAGQSVAILEDTNEVAR